MAASFRPPVRAGAGDDGPRLADIFRRHGPRLLADDRLSPRRHRVLQTILKCRTAALGGHLYVCDRCGHRVPVYNSCRNRHCPTCQSLDQARWIAARTERLLPVGHHHVVFTLPAQLRPLARRHPRQVYGALFTAASRTLELLAKDVLGARLGITAVLHTWTRTLDFHPHLHCIVTAGGLALDGSRWVERTRYLFHVDRMKAVFRGRLLAELQRLHRGNDIVLDGDEYDADAWGRLVRALPPPGKWVVYVQPPFSRSTHVVKYLGRYTHRVGISDARLIAADDRGVTFRTHGDDHITLPPDVFLRRFLQHVLPRAFHKIRHFGLYSSAHQRPDSGLWRRARDLIAAPDTDPLDPPPDTDTDTDALALLHALTGIDPLQCPACERGRLHPRPLPRPRARAP